MKQTSHLHTRRGRDGPRLLGRLALDAASDEPCIGSNSRSAARIPGLRSFLCLCLSVCILISGAGKLALAQELSLAPGFNYRNTVYDQALTNSGTSLTQTLSVAVFNGHVGYAGDTNAPNDEAIYLTRSAFGQPVAGPPARIRGERTFLFGEQIIPATDLGVRVDLPPALIDPAHGAAFVPGLDRTVATAPGFVSITWIRNDGTTNSPVLYYVESAPGQETRRMYCTDTNGTPTGAPGVDVSGVSAVIHTNLSVTAANLQQITNHLRAQNITGPGRILLEYRDRSSGSYVGLELVDVLPYQPDVVSSVDVGAFLAPQVSYTNQLKPLVSRGLNTTPPPFAYQYNRPGDTNDGIVFAVRPTSADDQIELFWFRDGLASVIWPYEMHRYTANWPAPLDPGLRRLYTTEDSDGSPTSAPKVWLPTNAIPQVFVHYNDALSASQFWLDPASRLLNARSLVGSQPQYILLHYESPQNPGFMGLQFVEVWPYLHSSAVTSSVDVGVFLTPQASFTNGIKPLVSRGWAAVWTNAYLPYACQYNRTGDLNDGNTFAVRPTSTNDQIELFWFRDGLASVIWPYEMHRYTADWPANFGEVSRRIYLTLNADDTLTGAPKVTIPSGAVPDVRIHYNDAIPAETNLAGQNLWFWLTAQRELNAKIKTGRILLHYEYEQPASPGFIGVEFVDVRPYAPDLTDDWHIGDRLLPAVAYPETHGLKPVVSRGQQQTRDDAAGYAYKHGVVGEMEGFTFAVRRTTADDQVELFWLRYGLQNVVWPYEMHRYRADWPPLARRDKYQRYVRGSTPNNYGPNVALPSDLSGFLMPWQEPPSHAQPVSLNNFSTTNSGWSLLQYNPGTAVCFQVVHSVLHADTSEFDLSLNAWAIGTEVTEPIHAGPRGGYIHVLETMSPKWDRYDCEIYNGNTNNAPDWQSAWTTKQVFAVNKGPLEVWWSNVNTNGDVQWPSLVKRYDNVWPSATEKIIVASQKGTGAMDTNVYRNFRFYYQNDPARAGFNPNDEHAFKFTAFGAVQGGGEAIFALRDDLGTSTTSEPYVLVKYQNPFENDRWSFRVFQVLAEGTGSDGTNYTLNYPATAGSLIRLPYPLSYLNFLQPCDENQAVSGPYWRDRKKDYWARAAGDDGGAANIIMRYSYATNTGMIPGLYFPASKPAFGGLHVAWLDRRPGGTPGVPTDIGYTVAWPAEVPELSIGETLVKPKFGLPDISQQTSVELLYQQSLTHGTNPNVKLIDPTRVRQVALTQLPADVETASDQGMVYFPKLPPHLRTRLYYDPSNHKLNFTGDFVEPVAGEYYLLLNVITAREKAVLLNLSSDGAFNAALNQLCALAAQVWEVPPNTAFQKPLALTAGMATEGGYVTVAMNNSTNLNQPSDPISLYVIRVSCPLYHGELKPIASDNPFDEKFTLRHSGDFAGRANSYFFEWRTLPPEDGLPSTRPPAEWGYFSGSGQGALDTTIEGSGLYTLSDNFFICRYGTTNSVGPCLTNWSEWTAPMLVPGWIKRVLTGINPFDQRFTSFANTSVNTIVSMLSQAGPRSVGATPLNAAGAQNYGLLEIYETVFKRGAGLSIEGALPVDYGPADDALLLVASRIADLYMLFGNEAYADAADPTIAYGTDSGQYGSEASTIHCFQNQTASLLEEELDLLRGRDDSLLPSVQTYPFYNRLIWNFTESDGEVAYAANYDIRDHNTNGVINEADARIDYPQGHGDAWGHYLMAIKPYYYLLRNPNFTWIPRAESVLVGGVPVSVDYMDERKFAQAAAARAKTGAEIVGLTYRSFYVEDPIGQYQGYQDSNTNRAWGLAEWGSRAGQGALFDWVVGNAMLPPSDTNHTGIQKIDRSTVTELREIASAFLDVQQQADKADAGLNPLGAAKNVVPFDIDPTQIANGTTHYEQIYGRAVKAMNNAIAVFNHANNSSQLLRRQADTVTDFQRNVQDREADFNNRLVEVFGYPYSDDIGPTGTYATGYNGPDLYHFMYNDSSTITGEATPPGVTISVTNTDYVVSPSGGLTRSNFVVRYQVNPDTFGLVKPANWVGQRRAPGQLQTTHSDLLQAKARFNRALTEYDNLLNQIDDQAALLQQQYSLNAEEIHVLYAAQNVQEGLNEAIRRSRERQLTFQTKARIAGIVANAWVEGMPKNAGWIGGWSFGVFFDPTSALRNAILLANSIYTEIMSQEANRESLAELDHQQAKEIAQSLSNLRLTTIRQEQGILQQVAQLEQLVRQEALLRLDIYTQQEALQQAAGRYSSTLAQGQRLLEDRLRFRQQTAAQVQAYRYKDMAFRIFRNDALQKYRAQFDMAALYVFLAAKAYDYETNLRPGDPAQPDSAFINDIVRARTIGLIVNGIPVTGASGDGGLADAMARMDAAFSVLKGQLYINNPQFASLEFSLQSQLMRIVPSTNSSTLWRQALARCWVPDLNDVAEFKQHCAFENANPEPGLVIPFQSTVVKDLNHFGWPYGGGDSRFNDTAFATKIKSIGVSFLNYRTSGAGAMGATPYVYLVPVGSDIMRSPRRPNHPADSINYTREWKVVDQWLPIPLALSGKNDPLLSLAGWIPINSLQTYEQPMGNIRAQPTFLAWQANASGQPTDPQFKATYLISRSVWNNRWLLVIPASSLSANYTDGLNRFIFGGLLNPNGPPDGPRDGNGVSDIKLRIEAYYYGER